MDNEVKKDELEHLQTPFFHRKESSLSGNHFNIKVEKILNFLKVQSKKYGLGEVIFDFEADPEIESIFKIKVPKNISFEEMNHIWDEITENTEKYTLKDRALTKYFHDVFIILEK